MPPICPSQSRHLGNDDFSDSSTEDSFLLYKNMQRRPNIPMPVFKKPSTKVFAKISPSVVRVRKSMISHLMHPRKKSLISSTPRNPSCKTSVSQNSSFQVSPIIARANSILAGNLESVQQTQKVLNDLHPKLSFSSNTELELRMSKSYDAQPIKKVKQINISVRNVVEHLNREMLKKKRKSIGKLDQRNSNVTLKENATLTNRISQLSGTFSGDSRTVSDTTKTKPPKSEKPKPLSLEKMLLMERETQTTDSLNKGLPKQSIGSENQNGNKKSDTLRNSSENETIEEFLEQFDADVAVYRPSIITISSASEAMSPDRTNNSQGPPEPTNQNSYNNNTIFDTEPKIRNVTLTQNNNLELSSKKEKRNVKNSSQLNVSHNTRSFKMNSMSKANDEPATKSEKRTRTTNNSNHNQEQEHVNSASENISPVISSSISKQPPQLQSQNVNNSSQLNVSHNTRSFKINSMTNANGDPAAKEEKRTATKTNSNRNQKQLENANSLNNVSQNNRSTRSRSRSRSINKSLNKTVSQLNVSHDTQSFKINSMIKANDDIAAKEGKIVGTKTNATRNQKQLENANSLNSVSRNTRSRSQSIVKSLNETAGTSTQRPKNEEKSTQRSKNKEKSSNSAAEGKKPTSRQNNIENKEKSTNTSEMSKTKRKTSRETVVPKNNSSELGNSSIAIKKSRQRKTSNGSKGKSHSNRNSAAIKEDKKYNSKRASTAVARKSKASTSNKRASTAVARKSKVSTSKITNFQPYIYNRLSGFVQIEHNHPTLNFINQPAEGERRSQRQRKVPLRYIQATVIAPIRKRRRSVAVRQSAAQQPSKTDMSTISELTNADKSNLETTTDNENVFKKPQLRSSTKRRRRSRSDISVVKKKLKSITSSANITDDENNQTDLTPLSKGHDYSEGVDSGAYTMSKEISARTVTVRSSPMPSCSHWNDNVPVNYTLPKQSEEISKSPDLPVGSISEEQLQEMPENSSNVIIHENVVVQPPIETTTMEKTVTEVPSQIDASLPKHVEESIRKSITSNEAPLQTSKNQFAQVLFPRNSTESESPRRLPDFDDEIQDDQGKETQNKENVNDEGLDQNTLYTLINNEVVSVEWISQMPPSQSSKSSQGVTVTYLLNNLKTIQGTISNGLIRFDPGQHRIQVTKKHCIVYKVEQGEAVVNIQLQKRNVGVGCCFHIPLGSTYSITNLSQVEPLVLFFTKVSAS